MQLWTTFCPSKITWELTAVSSKNKHPTSDWQRHQELIASALHILKVHGISGIRLVIFPTEITTDGKEINWQPIETMLAMCVKEKLLVDLCIGPFQYPYYPGIYLPEQLQKEITHDLLYLDGNTALAVYGIAFLQKQLTRYSKDTRLHGFHLANEWPDRQGIFGQEHLKIGVSKEFMIKAATLLKQQTTKPIALNTNIDAADTQKLQASFTEVLSVLGEQGRLGFDIYPSQETWRKVPLQKARRLLASYPTSFARVCEVFSSCEMYFAEVEAQPWGNGKSWYQIIANESHPEESILGFTPESLPLTWKKHIANTPVQTVSLWGADFWLSADALKITWPMEMIKAVR